VRSGIVSVAYSVIRHSAINQVSYIAIQSEPQCERSLVRWRGAKDAAGCLDACAFSLCAGTWSSARMRSQLSVEVGRIVGDPVKYGVSNVQ
jgi:hypothetical protein